MSFPMLRRFVLAAAIVLAVAPFASAEDVSPPFGSLSLKKLNGEKATLQQFRGQVVLLNFWATWCKPCVGEMPLLAALAKKYQGRGFKVVAASLDDPAEEDTVARFAGRLPEGMEVWVGATLDDMARLKMGSAVPVTVLLDREGRVLGARQGAITEGLLDSDIEQALGKDDAPRRKPKHLPGLTEAAARGLVVVPSL